MDEGMPNKFGPGPQSYDVRRRAVRLLKQKQVDCATSLRVKSEIYAIFHQGRARRITVPRGNPFVRLRYDSHRSLPLGLDQAWSGIELVARPSYTPTYRFKSAAFCTA